MLPYRLLYLSFIILVISCGPPVPHSRGETTINERGAQLQVDFMRWWTYHSDSIHLSLDFLPLDSLGMEQSKSAFLAALTRGDCIPLRSGGTGSRPTYRLYHLGAGSDPRVGQVIAQAAEDAKRKLLWEGRPLPPLVLTDLEGNTHSNDSLRGKSVIIKCWFLACAACIKEFDELNRLVDQYKSEDVVFLSLAYDPEPKIRKFLAGHRLDYATAAVDREFLEGELGVTAYPTHLFVDRQGIVRKVVNSVEELDLFLQQTLPSQPSK